MVHGDSPLRCHSFIWFCFNVERTSNIRPSFTGFSVYLFVCSIKTFHYLSHGATVKTTQTPEVTGYSRLSFHSESSTESSTEDFLDLPPCSTEQGPYLLSGYTDLTLLPLYVSGTVEVRNVVQLQT